MSEVQQRATTPATTPRSGSDWIDRWFGDWSVPSWPELRRLFPENAAMLRVEEFTEGDELVVRSEMPGIDPEKDVDIQVTDQTLRLRAERRQESKVEEKGRYRSEFQYGSFVRTIPLPAGATDADVKATYKDGILEVRIPVNRQAAEATRIPVQRA
jgi:HSP20 family protein